MPEHRAKKKLKPLCSFFTFSFDAKLVCSVIEGLLKEIFKMIITTIYGNARYIGEISCIATRKFFRIYTSCQLRCSSDSKTDKTISIQITSNSLVVFNSVILGRLSHVFLM